MKSEKIINLINEKGYLVFLIFKLRMLLTKYDMEETFQECVR